MVMNFTYEWRKKLRLEWFDYSSVGYYFVTICTKGRIDYFWEIQGWESMYNDYWDIAYKCWKDIVVHYQWIKLDEFMIMPNHIHGIIIVGNEYFRSDKEETTRPNISNIIKWFKIWVTKEVRQNYWDYEFAWQKSFHDVIIRNQEQLDKTREYIILNPSKWDEDVNNQINIKPWNA